MRKTRILGLMSGTSLDGLDLCLADFWQEGDQHRYDIVCAETRPYSAIWLSALGQAMQLSSVELLKLDRAYGTYLGTEAKSFLEKYGQSAEAVASHGHTVFHNPAEGYTLQIGHGGCIAEAAGLPSISDFRSSDVALGGQGAPLVPIGDKLLFSDYGAALNIGGFANISFTKPGGDRISFDICPANVVLNRLCQRLGLAYDAEGQIARSKRNEIDLQVLNRLDAHPYFALPYPKSLGAEWVEAELSWFYNSGIDTETLIATYTMHIGNQIAKAVTLAGNGTKVLATGGGVHNTFLIETIRREFTDQISTEVPTAELIDFKEALIFAFLGHLRLQNLPNCIPSVTGARRAAVGGAVYMPGQGILL